MRFRLVQLMVLGATVCGSACSRVDADGRSGNTGAQGGAAEYGDGAGSDGEPASSAPPPVASGRPICIISADCPSGQHCDLGECVQDCNENSSCSGTLVCSARARCVAKAEDDRDPAPTTKHEGTVSVTPLWTDLTGNEQSLKLTLRSTSHDPVGYRVETNAPFLSLGEPRGEFTESGVIEFGVDASAHQGQDVLGSVRVFTTLGTLVASTSLHSGLTGKYHGALRYNSGPVDLGDARLALDLVEKNGDVRVRVDPQASLLFPPGSQGPVTGLGNYVPQEALELTIEQPIEATLGGLRNHLGRPVMRRLTLHLTPTQSGVWDGTFDESVLGLFVRPVELAGRVRLQYLSKDIDDSFDEDIAPSSGTAPAEVVGNEFSPIRDVFGRSAVPSADDYATRLQKGHAPLLAAMQDQVATGAMSFSTLREHCESALGLRQVDPEDTGLPCGDAVELAQALLDVAQTGVPSRATDARWFGTFMQALAAPAVLAAQDHLVEAVRVALESGSVASETQEYDAATSALSPVIRWFFQPAMLEFLRNMTESGAVLPPDLSGLQLPESSPDTLQDEYPAARTLARLLRLVSEADAERTRLVATSNAESSELRVSEAQDKALLAYLESVAALEVISHWKGVSPAVAATLTGVLQPLDASFGALSQGTDALGIPEGYVPFVYREGDERDGSTNFEQVLGQALAAAQAAASEEQLLEGQVRRFDVDQHALESERAALERHYDAQLRALCGAGFDPEAMQAAEDWAGCGALGGHIGSLAAELEQAHVRQSSEENRIQGMEERIEIAEAALAESQRVRRDTLTFIDDNGKELSATALDEGKARVDYSSVQMAVGSSSLNAGSPAVQAGAESAMESTLAQLDARRQELYTAQAMRIAENDAKVELGVGMADIKRQAIDLAQLRVDIQQYALEVLQRGVEAHNALDEAKRLFGERARALEIAGRNPIGDPSFRLGRDQQTQAVLMARKTAQRGSMLAARALQYEINLPLSGLSGAVLAARTGADMQRLLTCMQSVFDGYQEAYGAPQEYTSTVSVREMLGITGPRQDTVTGEHLSEGQQFRMLVLRNENLTEDDGVTIEFSTNLEPGTGIWSADVCNDRILSVQAQLVGDFLGDNEAEIHATLSGAAVQRACDTDELRVWSIQARDAVIQAGVNTFGEAKPNQSFYGQAVARATWDILIRNGDIAAANRDVDFTKLEDIVLKITHAASAQQSSPEVVKNLSCAAGFSAQ